MNAYSIKKNVPITSVVVGLAIIFSVIILTFITTAPASGSTLDEFETAATKDGSQQESDDQKQKDQDKNSSEDSLESFDFFMKIIGHIIYYTYEGTKMSYARVGGSTDIDPAKIEIRQAGEPTLPFYEVDYKYMYVNSEIIANDIGVQLGNGPLGFECRSTWFAERNPKDNLTLTQYHVLLRMSPNRSQEYGIGVGTLYLSGNGHHSGFSITFPIKFYPKHSFGIQFKPTYSWINGNLINDNDLSFVLTKKFGSIELGYRSLDTNGKSLNGSYIGLAWHY